MKDFIKRNKFNIFIIVIYALITFITVLLHESWRDEAQGWLIAKELSFIDIFKQMKYEGHPCLWHLIISPFAKLGFPYITQNLISWIIMCITAILILWKAPFNILMKTLILFSSPFIYGYSVVARSYSLIPLALVLIAITYKNRKEKPIKYVLSITLLAHTHVLMLGLVGILYLFFFFEEIIIKFHKKNKQEKKKILFSLLIAILGLVVLFIQLFSSLKANAIVEQDLEINKDKISLAWNTLKKIMINTFGVTNLAFLIPILVISIIIYIYQFTKSKKFIAILLTAITFQLFIQIFIYSALTYQKTYAILLILIFCEWIQKYENPINNTKTHILLFDFYLSFILIFNCIVGVNFIKIDLKYNYSYAKQTATFINNNLPSDSIFVASNIPRVSAIIPYITNVSSFWSPQVNNYFTFTTWNEKIKLPYTIDEFTQKINNKFNNENDIFFIYSYDWEEEELKCFIDNTRAKEVFRTETSSMQKDEKYIIYKLYNS